MTFQPKILAFAGSTRNGSYNKKLLVQAAKAAEVAGAKVTVIDLKDWPMPLYDGDLETQSGIPEKAIALKELMKDHQGFLIASPEYNSSISGVLKNTLDWVSRPASNETPLICFKGKVAALMSASPGNLGGLRGLVTLRSILENLGTFVIPDQVAIPKVHEAFDEGGQFKDPKQKKLIEGLSQQLVKVTIQLNATI